MTTLASGASRAIGMLTALISVPLTYRYLGPERYGLWMVLTSIIATMSFADLGLGNGLMNAISEAYGKDDHRLARQYITSALVLMLGISAVLTIAGAIGYPFIPWVRVFNVKSEAAAVEGAHAFLLLYAALIVNLPLGIIYRAQAGLQKGYASQVVATIGNIASLGAVLFVIWMHGSLFWLVAAATFTGILATIANGFLLFRGHPWLLPVWHAYSPGSAHKLFNLGMMFLVLQVTFTIAYTSDNIVIAQILGVAAVAAYAVPQKLFGFLSVVVGMAIGPLWPAYSEAISRGDVAWVRRVFFGSLWLVLTITVPVGMLLVFAGPWILRVAFGKSLHAPLSLLIVLAVWAVVNAVSAVTSILLNGAGILKQQTAQVIVASLSNLALSIFLTRRYGVVGVCLGSIITQLLITFPVYVVLIGGLFKNLAMPIADRRLEQSV